MVLTGRLPGYATGEAELLFTVNKPPYGGRCRVDPSHGIGDESIFSFSCTNWIDKDVPLTYEYFYRNTFGMAILIYRGPKQKVKTKLPVGNPTTNYTLDFAIRIADNQGAFNTTAVKVQVNLSFHKNHFQIVLVITGFALLLESLEICWNLGALLEVFPAKTTPRNHLKIVRYLAKLAANHRLFKNCIVIEQGNKNQDLILPLSEF